MTAEATETEQEIDWKHVWNAASSVSGYKKIPYGDLTAAVDNYQGQDEGSPHNPNGNAKGDNIVDGKTATYWHTRYKDNQHGGNGNALTFTDNDTDHRRISGNNTITITLKNAADIAGFTLLPRQDDVGNGVIQEFTVDVQADESTEWQQAYAHTGEVWPHASMSYVRNEAHWGTETNEKKAEREFVFDRTYARIKKVRFTVTKTDGSEAFEQTNKSNNHITCAEISILQKRDITEKPELQVSLPAAAEAVPMVTPAKEKMTIYDKAANPADVTGNFQVTSEAGYPEVFTGQFTVDNASKMRITSAEGMVLTFDYKCTENYTGDKVFVKKGNAEYRCVLNTSAAAASDKKISFSVRRPSEESPLWHQAEKVVTPAFLNQWHKITIYSKSGAGNMYVDGAAATVGRGNAGAVVVNPANTGDLDFNVPGHSGEYFANVKLYSGVTEDISTSAKLDTVLASKTPVFELGTKEVDLNYAVTSTTWKNAANEEVQAFAADGERYTMTTVLTAKDCAKFTAASKPTTMQVNIPGEETPMEVTLAGSDVTVAPDGSTMTITHTFEPVTMHVAVANDCVRMGTVSIGSYDSAVTENGSASYVTYYNGKVQIVGTPRPGYAFEGWYTDAAGTVRYEPELDPRASHKIEKVRAEQTLYAKFEPKETHSRFRVTVLNKTGEKSYVTNRYWEGSYNDSDEEHVVDLGKVTDASMDIPTGKVFSHWAEKKNLDSENEETKKIVFSANRNLRFRIPGDLELVPVFKDANGSSQTESAYAEVSDTYLIRNEADLSANAKVRFVGKLHIPDGWTLNETGLLWTGKGETGTSDDAFRLEEDGTKKLNVHKIEASKINVSYQFSATVSGVPVGKTLYGRIYAKVTHGETTEWIYSDIVPVTHTDIQTIPAAE